MYKSDDRDDFARADILLPILTEVADKRQPSTR